jgi:signal peptidase I
MKNISVIIILFSFLSCSLNKDHYEASSEAMLPNIDIGDYIIVDSSVEKFTYGDIVLYRHDRTRKLGTSLGALRVTGLPEDSIRIDQDICVINGKKNSFNFIQQSKHRLYDFSFDEYEEEFPNCKKIIIYHSSFLEEKEITKAIKVPKGYYFLLGDNRSDAIDSRYYGPVAKDKILGKVIEIKKEGVFADL